MRLSVVVTGSPGRRSATTRIPLRTSTNSTDRQDEASAVTAAGSSLPTWAKYKTKQV
jgi:hypothetical protein